MNIAELFDLRKDVKVTRKDWILGILFLVLLYFMLGCFVYALSGGSLLAVGITLPSTATATALVWIGIAKLQKVIEDN